MFKSGSRFQLGAPILLHPWFPNHVSQCHSYVRNTRTNLYFLFDQVVVDPRGGRQSAHAARLPERRAEGGRPRFHLQGPNLRRHPRNHPQVQPVAQGLPATRSVL